MNGHQAVAAIALGIQRIGKHAFDPQRGVGHGHAIVLGPGDDPLGPAGNGGVFGVDRLATQSADDRGGRPAFRHALIAPQAVARRAQLPAASGHAEGRIDGLGGGLGQFEVAFGVLFRGYFPALHAFAAHPDFGRPKPVVIHGVERGDAPEHALVEFAHNSQIVRVFALRL